MGNSASVSSEPKCPKTGFFANGFTNHKCWGPVEWVCIVIWSILAVCFSGSLSIAILAVCFGQADDARQ